MIPASSGGDEPALTLDCRAMRCPLPIIELAKHIGDVATGDVVVVIADDPAAAADVPAWCRLTGHEYLGADVTSDSPDSHTQAPAYRVRRLH